VQIAKAPCRPDWGALWQQLVDGETASGGLFYRRFTLLNIDRRWSLAAPELTRSTGIQLNARLSLRRPCELLTLSQSRDLADAASIGGHAYRAIRGRCCVIEGSGPAHSLARDRRRLRA